MAEAPTSEGVEFSGWLTKQSAWLKEWRRRWFKLVGSRLDFAKGIDVRSPFGIFFINESVLKIPFLSCITEKAPWKH